MFVIRLGKSVQMKRYETLEEAKLDAQGMLLSRSAERKAEILPIVQDRLGGLGDPIATVSRSRRGGPITWK